jgi:transposase, IS5 family
VESVLPGEVRRLPAELAQVDALLDDPAFFALLEPFFDPRMGRPSTPMETYLRFMFLMFRYRLGYQSLCRGGAGFDHVADRSRIDTTEGVRIWVGHGVWAHDLVKIGTLAA